MWAPIIAAQAFGFAVLASIVASQKDLDVVPWFMIGLLFGIFGFIASLIVGKGEGTGDDFDPEARDKKCPDCAERIKLEARVCKHCGHEWTDEEVQRQIEEARPSEEGGAGNQTEESPLTTRQQWAAAGAFFAVVTLIGILVTALAGG